MTINSFQDGLEQANDPRAYSSVGYEAIRREKNESLGKELLHKAFSESIAYYDFVHLFQDLHRLNIHGYHADWVDELKRLAIQSLEQLLDQFFVEPVVSSARGYIHYATEYTKYFQELAFE